MAFITINYNTIKEQSEGASNVIDNTGVYKIKIENVIYKKKKYKDIFCDECDIRYSIGGSIGYLFGIRLQQTDGKDHYKKQLLESLCVLKGLKELKKPTKTTISYKNGETKEIEHFSELSGMEVYVYVIKQYSRYNDKIYKSFDIKNFYSVKTKQTCFELINNQEAKKFNIDSLNKEPILKDLITQSEVDEFERIQKEIRENGNNNVTKDISDDEIPF